MSMTAKEGTAYLKKHGHLFAAVTAVVGKLDEIESIENAEADARMRLANAEAAHAEALKAQAAELAANKAASDKAIEECERDALAKACVTVEEAQRKAADIAAAAEAARAQREAETVQLVKQADAYVLDRQQLAQALNEQIDAKRAELSALDAKIAKAAAALA